MPPISLDLTRKSQPPSKYSGTPSYKKIFTKCIPPTSQVSPSLKRKLSDNSPVSFTIDPSTFSPLSSYSTRSSYIQENYAILLKNSIIPLRFIGSGTFSKVFISEERNPSERLLEGISNDQVVVKLLHSKYCGKPDPVSNETENGLKQDLAISMIKKAALQYSRLEKLFQNRPQEERPVVIFHNPEQVLECGYSLFERVIPMKDLPIWDPYTPFSHLDEFQKKTYNSLLELILIDKFYQKLRLLILEIEDLGLLESSIAKDYLLGLDLKWDNLGFRTKNNNEKQLVLLDISNTDIESGIGVDEPGLFLNTENLCSGPHNNPNKEIAEALSRKEIAFLPSFCRQNPYYTPLIDLKIMHENLETLHSRLKILKNKPIDDQSQEFQFILNKINLIIELNKLS